MGVKISGVGETTPARSHESSGCCFSKKLFGIELVALEQSAEIASLFAGRESGLGNVAAMFFHQADQVIALKALDQRLLHLAERTQLAGANQDWLGMLAAVALYPQVLDLDATVGGEVDAS